MMMVLLMPQMMPLLGPDDDFGFNETTTFFSDSKTYSPTQQTDI